LAHRRDWREHNLGTVAVIAPTRIQYQEMIQAVSYIAGLSERILEVPVE
jgi:heat-inducible transcriptional repressor